MGVFTTRHISRHEKVLRTVDGLTIPLFGFLGGVQGPNRDVKRAWVDLWANYVWSGNKPDHISYHEDINANGRKTMSSYAPCYSSLTNHHCMLASLQQHYPEPFYDDTLADRFQNASAGAFTYDMGRENTVYRDVEPGEELFLNYLYCRHGKEGTPEWAENGIMPKDVLKAEELTLKLLRIKKGQDGGIVINPPDHIHLPKDTPKLVADLVPKTKGELEEMVASVDSVSDLKWSIARNKGLNHYGDPNWVRANGMCLENYVPSKSTVIPQAGRGGIAQFLVQQGEMVAPAPLLQIMNKGALTMYKRINSEKQLVARWTEIGKQLLLNYCFGHPQSPLLLCPQTNVVLLNHCSLRTKECGDQGPNAAIRWAGDWHSSTKSWLEMSLEDMALEQTGGLAFEVVALRDIQPGEEVFIDYGIEWEQAWAEHVQNWNQPRSSSDEKDFWISAKQANDMDSEISEAMISGDLRATSDHPYLFTGCQYWASSQDEHTIFQKEADWMKLGDEEILDLYADPSSNEDAFGGYEVHRDHTYWPCSILKQSEDGSKTYTVRIHQSPFEDEQPWERYGVPRLVTNYPRAAIHYFVKPNMSDQQLDGTFRHPIGIPDSMLPPQWKIIPE